ncbi:MAG TPA: hypothetical protein VGC42_04330 [Kofleriaceae bacterium]
MARRLIAWLGVASAVLCGPARADGDALQALLGRIDAVAREVSRVRGLPLTRAIANDVVDRDELRARLTKAAAEDKAATQTAAEGFGLERWGMIPPGIAYPALLIELMTEQIAGYYDTESKKLTISRSAGDDPGWAEMVLAHELDHGLQDQRFDLHKFEDLEDGDDDAALARRALVEGDGVVLMFEVLANRAGKPVTWTPRLVEAIARGMSAPGAGDEAIDRAPLAIREAMLFPYRAGFGFVAALRRRQPWSRIDAVFARPPRSTEQILHVERYLADDRPVPVALDAPAALPGFAIVDRTVWGELGYTLWLRSHGVDPRLAAQAAAGWGGDRMIVVARPSEHRPSQAVGIARSEWDTEADAVEAAEAAGKALADAVVGATVERTPTRLRLLGLDGKLSWVERRHASLVIVLGAPAWSADALATELWAAKPKR